MQTDAIRPVPKGLDLVPAYFEGRIERVSESTLRISGEQTGGLLGRDGFTGVTAYIERSSDICFPVFEDALAGQMTAQVKKLRVA